MVEIGITDLSKSFGHVRAVHRVSLTVRSGELFFLLGPSGCGKTTLLRLIAGFENPDAGHISFNGSPVDDVPPNRRNAGMVFQNYALWPHLNVFRNISYGLEIRKIPRPERRRRVEETLALVRLTGLADRYPSQLSGGQQQRVALARALVIDPGVVLLDEPLSNLDAKLRADMRREIRRIHDETRITMVYVTHDQIEALSLADRIAVMRDGCVSQLGSPRELYRTPLNSFVASFLGRASLFEGRVSALNPDGTLVVQTPLGPVLASASLALDLDEPVVCAVRAESVRLSPPAPASSPNSFPVTVSSHTYQGDTVLYELLGPGPSELLSLMMGDLDPGLRPGQPALASFSPQNVSLMRK